MSPNSYIIITFSSYTTVVLPSSCILVNTTISVVCTNLQQNIPSITGINISIDDITKININTNIITQTVAIKVSDSLKSFFKYNLQICLSNPIPSIKTISDSL